MLPFVVQKYNKKALNLCLHKSKTLKEYTARGSNPGHPD